MDLGLSNKKVLITGASRGIGAAIAEGFLEEGAIVVIVSRGSDKLYKTYKDFKNKYGKNRIYVAKCDCTDISSIENVKTEICVQLGGIDIVVPNIGDGRSVPDALPSKKQWDITWQNNFESALVTARTFLPELIKNKGCMLFVSSITAKEAFGAPVDYSTAKTAVASLSKNIARKVAKDVRVNVIAPGNVLFPGGSWDKKLDADPDMVNRIIATTVPMNRFGTTKEIADAAVFLCSERASFITGAVLVVDGGQTVSIF